MTAIILNQANIRLITTADYHRMAAVGIFAADERVELIAGQIIQKMPKGSVHSALCKRIEKLLEKRLEEKVLVRMQDPVLLDNYSEPEPDIAVVHPKTNFYADRHPTSDEVYLIIEISDTTLKQDLGVKANLYAAAGIIDYWVFNVAMQQLHVFREPQADGYQRQIILKSQQSISLLAFPSPSVTVQECFGVIS